MVSLKATPSVLARVGCNRTSNGATSMGSSVSLFYKNQGLANNICSTFVVKRCAAGPQSPTRRRCLYF
jgi:hypothetical protein